MQRACRHCAGALMRSTECGKSTEQHKLLLATYHNWSVGSEER